MWFYKQEKHPLASSGMDPTLQGIFPAGTTPQWLVSQRFKIGIQALLQQHRCTEENEQLASERRVFDSWIKTGAAQLRAAWKTSTCR